MNKQFKKKQFVRRCKRLIRASLFGLYATVAFNTNSSVAAPGGKLEDWRFSPQGSQLEISLSAPVRPQYFYLSEPPRIVVDLPDTKLGYVPTQQNYNGAIQKIRVSQLNDDITRIVMDLAPGAIFDRSQVQLQPTSWQNPTRWVFRPILLGNSNLNFLPPGSQSIGGELPPGAGVQLPPGAYNPQLPYNPSYNSQPPGFLPTPEPNGSLPPGMYNPSLPPINGVNTRSQSFTAPLPSTSIRNRSMGQPNVSVPPITTIRTNSSPLIPSTALPPAKFPSPSGNINPSPSFFPTQPTTLPTIDTSNSTNSSGSRVIEFGEPFPTPNR